MLSVTRHDRGVCALIGLTVCLLGRIGAHEAQNRQTFRSGIRSVVVYATVQDREGRLVPDLTRDDFQVLDNGRPVEIRTFSNELVPITVALMLDMSGSMGAEALRVRDSAAHFVDAIGAGDRVRIGSFGDEVALSPYLTDDKSILKRVINEELWPIGATALWSGVAAGMRSLDAESGRRVVLVLSDGGDMCALRTLDEGPPLPMGFRRPGSLCAASIDVRRTAIDGEFMIYAIGMEGPGLDSELSALAAETGGGHFRLKRNDDLSSTFSRVIEELHHQYLLSFEPAVLDGRTHRLEVRLTKPRLTARSRRSYVAR